MHTPHPSMTRHLSGDSADTGTSCTKNVTKGHKMNSPDVVRFVEALESPDGTYLSLVRVQKSNARTDLSCAGPAILFDSFDLFQPELQEYHVG